MTDVEGPRATAQAAERATVPQQTAAPQQTGAPQQQATPQRTTAPQPMAGEPQRTGWAGWVMFAGVMALIVGVLQAIAGLVALFDDGYYVVTRQGLVVHMTYTQWGWIHLAFGAALVGIGAGLLAGQTWARVLGIAVAGLSVIANFLFLRAYPFWSVVMITVDFLVIYAIAAHGGEMKSRHRTARTN